MPRALLALLTLPSEPLGAAPRLDPDKFRERPGGGYVVGPPILELLHRLLQGPCSAAAAKEVIASRGLALLVQALPMSAPAGEYACLNLLAMSGKPGPGPGEEHRAAVVAAGAVPLVLSILKGGPGASQVKTKGAARLLMTLATTVEQVAFDLINAVYDIEKLEF